jgi:hypothetical protein
MDSNYLDKHSPSTADPLQVSPHALWAPGGDIWRKSGRELPTRSEQPVTFRVQPRPLSHKTKCNELGGGQIIMGAILC